MEKLSPEVPIYIITEGNEPPFFTRFFKWDSAKTAVSTVLVYFHGNIGSNSWMRTQPCFLLLVFEQLHGNSFQRKLTLLKHGGTPALAVSIFPWSTIVEWAWFNRRCHSTVYVIIGNGAVTLLPMLLSLSSWSSWNKKVVCFLLFPFAFCCWKHLHEFLVVSDEQPLYLLGVKATHSNILNILTWLWWFLLGSWSRAWTFKMVKIDRCWELGGGAQSERILFNQIC